MQRLEQAKINKNIFFPRKSYISIDVQCTEQYVKNELSSNLFCDFLGETNSFVERLLINLYKSELLFTHLWHKVTALTQSSG